MKYRIPEVKNRKFKNTVKTKVEERNFKRTTKNEQSLGNCKK